MKCNCPYFPYAHIYILSHSRGTQVLEIGLGLTQPLTHDQ